MPRVILARLIQLLFFVSGRELVEGRHLLKQETSDFDRPPPLKFTLESYHYVL